jgi:hypothetical protein
MVMKIARQRRLANAEMDFRELNCWRLNWKSQIKNHKFFVPFCHLADIYNGKVEQIEASGASLLQTPARAAGYNFSFFL